MTPAEPHSRTVLPAAPAEDASDESIVPEFRSMPPKASFPMAVDLVVTGRGKPLPFPMDDDLPE